MQLNKQDLFKALGNNLIEIKGNFTVSHYSIDSRTLQKNDTFVSLKINKDGHDYLNEAISKEAGSLLISQNFYRKKPTNFENLIIVKDTLQAITDISKYNANLFAKQGGKLIGITGSVGKTTLKEALTFILQQNNVVSSTFGNFNNHIGLPLSLSHISDKAKFGVFEMGMSSKGEISHLSKILKPQVVVITEIAEAHSEFFIANENKSSLDLIADAKAEILDGLDDQSTLFLNQDNLYFNYIKNKAIQKGIKVISFSLINTKSDIYVKSISFKNYVMEITSSVFGNEISYEMKSIAKHNAMISSLAFGIAKYLEVDITKAIINFMNFHIPKGRGKISELLYYNKKITLIDDSYNANYKSMSSSIESLSNVCSPKIIILGDMLEIGENEINEHKKLKGSLLKIGKIKEVILIGNLMKNLHEDIKEEFSSRYFENYQDVINHLKGVINKGDLVFIKGSFGSLVHKISNYLQN